MSGTITLIKDRAGCITPGRPQVLDLDRQGMVREIAGVLLAWADDPAVRLIVLDGAGDRGL